MLCDPKTAAHHGSLVAPRPDGSGWVSVPRSFRAGKPVQVGDSLDDLGDKELIQSALREDVEAIRHYGEANPESWTGLHFENEPRVLIVASFVGDLERHELELRRLLAHPDRLLLEQARWTKSELDDMASEIHRTLRQRQAMTGRPVMARLGVGIDVVSVGLQADQEELAKELADRYGDAIELEVGAFGYPMGRERSWPRSPRGPDPEVVEIEGLELRLHPERRDFEVGDRGQADLVVRNVSTHHIGRFHCGQPLLSVLVDKSGQVVGGPAPAAIVGTGRSIDLDPGGELKIKVLIGTASYRTEFGYLLPPGQYWLRTYLRTNEGNPPYATTRTLSPPLEPVTIVERISREVSAPDRVRAPS
jgi:hypothetical protein